MTNEKFPHSQLGKTQTYGHNRSPQQKPETIRGEPWKRFQALPQNGVVAPPSSESLTPEQQKYKHYATFEQMIPTVTAAVPLDKGRKNRAGSFDIPQPPGVNKKNE